MKKKAKNKKQKTKTKTTMVMLKCTREITDWDIRTHYKPRKQHRCHVRVSSSCSTIQCTTISWISYLNIYNDTRTVVLSLGVLKETGTVYFSREHWCTPFFVGYVLLIFFVFCVVFVVILCLVCPKLSVLDCLFGFLYRLFSILYNSFTPIHNRRITTS